jgi:hypothetical protein
MNLRRSFPGFLGPLLAGGMVAVILTLVSGCESAPRGAASPNWVSVQRTGGGLSISPIYVVTLFADGRVLFEGQSWGKSNGSFTRTIPREQAAKIFTQLEAVDFWNRAPRYDTESATQGDNSVIVKLAPSDTPWTILTARSNGRFKRIDGLFYAPHELIDLKKEIEKVTRIDEWIGEPIEWKN